MTNPIIPDDESEPEEIPTEPAQIETPETVIDEIVADLDAIHKSFVDMATDVGYARDRYKHLRPYWAKYSNRETSDAHEAEVYTSGVAALISIRDQVRYFGGVPNPLKHMVSDISSGSVAFSSITNTTGSLIIPPVDNFIPWENTFPTVERNSNYADRIARLNPALSETYKAIRETLFGTRADPERGALYMGRQAFDHLFTILAPDNEVLKSKYWKKKKGDKPNQIHQDERIHYAANHHVKDRHKADILVKSAKHMKAVYKALNKAHARGDVHPIKARTALTELQSIFEQWIDAMDL